MEEATLKLSPKQNEYIRNAHRRWNLKVGAVRSGKSYVDICFIIPSRLRALKDLPGLNVIIGVSKETVERNVLQPMREIYGGDVVGTINSRNIAKVCGVPVYCLGAEKASQVAKIQGASIKYCYGDEIAKWNKDVFNLLKSRLDKPYSKFDGACNPETPAHWLKVFLDDPEIDAYIQKYTIFDNPFLPKDFVDNLCTEYRGTVFYKRYILGEWALAEGLIYPMYLDSIVEGAPLNEKGMPLPITDYCVSIDYGTMNAFAALLWCKRGGVWYAEKEYYYSGRAENVTKTDQEYMTDLNAWIEEAWSILAQEAHHTALAGTYYGRKIRTIIDPSAASFIACLYKADWAKVVPADNSVLDGIRETAVAMQLGRIKIRASLTAWKKEAEGYVWETETSTGKPIVEDRPIKVNNHAMDAMRYFVKTMLIAVKDRR